MFYMNKSEKSSGAAEFELAARLLKVTEFRLLEVAYCHWFGHSAMESYLEHTLMQYIAHDEVPCWARHYARETLFLYDQAGCIVPKFVTTTASAQCINPLLSTDLWILMTGTFLISLLLV